jgi:hydrogenase 3 maturation protease
MKHQVIADLATVLHQRLKNAHRIAIIGIGDDLSPFDCLGIYAAQEIEKRNLPSVRVFLAGTVPESITAPIRRFQPDHVILLDSADLNIRPGTINVVNPGKIEGNLVSTHVLPLSEVMKFIAHDSKTRVTLLGIQPDMTVPDKGLADKDREFLQQNLQNLSEILRDR